MHPAALIGRRACVVAASVLTVLSVVSLDIAADAGPTHTIGLGALALVVGAARIALIGRLRGLFATTSAAVVAQPALHALGEGLDPARAHAHPGPAGLAHTAVDSGITAPQLVLAVLVIVAVGTAEWLLELVALNVGRVLRHLLLVLRGTPQRFLAGPVNPTTEQPRRSGEVWIDYAAPRGPPRGRESALA